MFSLTPKSHHRKAIFIRVKDYSFGRINFKILPPKFSSKTIVEEKTEVTARPTNKDRGCLDDPYKRWNVDKNECECMFDPWCDDWEQHWDPELCDCIDN